MTLSERIRAALQVKPRTSRELSELLGVSVNDIGHALARMKKSGCVIAIGKVASSHGGRSTIVYALPGTPKLPADNGLGPELPRVRRAVRHTRGAGSGVIAGKITVGRGYRWGAGY